MHGCEPREVQGGGGMSTTFWSGDRAGSGMVFHTGTPLVGVKPYATATSFPRSTITVSPTPQLIMYLFSQGGGVKKCEILRRFQHHSRIAQL